MKSVAMSACLLMLCLCCLCGCGLIPGYRERFEAARDAQQTAADNADDAKCQSYGSKPGSDAYVACRMNLSNNREAADEAQRQAWLGVAQAGANMMAQPPPPPPSLAPADHVCIAANNTLYRC
jgi:hypothetical protein